MTLPSDPVLLAILGGAALALLVAFSGWRRRRALSKENRRLREHLNLQMTIQSAGQQKVLEEVEQLKRQNENLRISLAVLKNGPDRAELRMLHLYDHAIRLMAARAPGFAPAWEAALKEAEAELEKTETGLVAWIRRAVRPSLLFGHRAALPPSAPAAIDAADAAKVSAAPESQSRNDA